MKICMSNEWPWLPFLERWGNGKGIENNNKGERKIFHHKSVYTKIFLSITHFGKLGKLIIFAPPKLPCFCIPLHILLACIPVRACTCAHTHTQSPRNNLRQVRFHCLDKKVFLPLLEKWTYTLSTHITSTNVAFLCRFPGPWVISTGPPQCSITLGT